MSGNKKIQINKRLKRLPREELEKLNKAELIDKIVQLEAYNCQLKNILQKKLDEQDNTDDADYAVIQDMNDCAQKEGLIAIAPGGEQTKKNKKRNFDFNKAHKRHVLLKLLYFGWDYHGFACQEETNATIEYHLFKALELTCLIESRTTSNYHRCGRTDKEVSAFCQVISIDLRSKFPANEQLSAAALSAEIDYCGMLNRILPRNMQCISWMPLRSAVYSARFDCTLRTYRYYFPRGNLNLEAMRAACALLERHTDFRNFCKMDVHNGVTNYVRNLQKATVHMCPNENEDDRGYTMYYLEIKANAFLWHQIRCIMAVLLLVGQEKEAPQVISDLLDVETNPCKPQYMPAIGLPLNLFHCEFRTRSTKEPNYTVDTSQTDEKNRAEVKKGADVHEEIIKTNDSNGAQESECDTTAWIYNEENLQHLIESVQSEWTQFSIKCTMIRNVLHNLETTLDTQFQPQQVRSQVLLLQDGAQQKQHLKLLNRKRCESLENRIEHFVKKQRLIVNESVKEEVSKMSI